MIVLCFCHPFSTLELPNWVMVVPMMPPVPIFDRGITIRQSFKICLDHPKRGRCSALNVGVCRMLRPAAKASLARERSTAHPAPKSQWLLVSG